MKNHIILLLMIILVSFMMNCDEIAEKGTIKGNVSDGGQAVGGAYVLLLDSGDLIEIDQPLENGSITLGNGNYMIVLVEPGKKYFVVAIKDNNGDLKYTPGVDAIGYYGNYLGFQWIPTEVSVGSGQTLEDIDITEMYIL
jgi:hypothetical protein